MLKILLPDPKLRSNEQLIYNKMEGTLTNLIHEVPMAPGTSNKSQPLDERTRTKTTNYSESLIQNTRYHI